MSAPSGETPKRPPRFWFRALAFVMVGVGFSLAVELVSLVWLLTRGDEARPVLVSPSFRRTRYLPRASADVPGMDVDTVILRGLDPHLGFGHGPEVYEGGSDRWPGFAAYGAFDDEEAPLIVALGGSTTDPVVLRENWPKQLADVLRERGVEVRVLNGGTASHTSSFELLKLIRDVLPLEPDLVLSLSGINDLRPGHFIEGHPMVHEQQLRMYRGVLTGLHADAPVFPNTVALLRSLAGSELTLNLGTPDDSPPWAYWERNLRLMHAITEEMGISYLAFLQPTSGVGEYSPTDVEIAQLERRGADYLEDARSFYDEARQLPTRREYVVDLTGVFAGQSGLYVDPRHVEAAGNRLIAEAIGAEILQRGLVGGVSVSPKAARPE